MSEARQLFMEVSLAAQKQSFSEVEALNTFRGPQGPRGEPGSIDNLVINGKEAVPVDGKNMINLTPADMGALGKNETAVNANALNGKDADEYALHSDALTLEEIKASTDLTGKLPKAEAVKAMASDLGGIKASLCYFLHQEGYQLPTPYGYVMRVGGSSWFGTYVSDSYYICVTQSCTVYAGAQENGATEPTWKQA